MRVQVAASRCREATQCWGGSRRRGASRSSEAGRSLGPAGWRWWPGFVPGLVVLVLTGCGAGERTAAVPVVRDSAGITIVESSVPVLAGGGVRISAAPELEIGVLEGEEAYQFTRVMGATRLSDGRIVVANAGTSELRFYDAGGRHLQSVGGQGGGPGEFQYMRSLWRVAGDSLLVWDLGSRRLSLFDGEGRFVTSYSVRPPEGMLSDGTLIGDVANRIFDPNTPRSGLHRLPQYLLRYTRGDEVLDTLGALPGTERHVHLAMSGGSISSIEVSPPPFGRTTNVAVSGDLVYAGSADTYEVGVYRSGAGLERLIRLARAPREVTPAVIESLKEERLGAARDAEARRAVEQQFASLEFPEYLPAYRAIRVDAAGVLWVEDYRLPGDEVARWQLFDREGGWLTTVELPTQLRVLEIGTDQMLGLWRDEWDVEYLRVYGVDRSIN